MDTDITKVTEQLEQVLASLEGANLPIAAAHVSTAVELLKIEAARARPEGQSKLRIV
jgi:hypothetical protein